MVGVQKIQFTSISGFLGVSLGGEGKINSGLVPKGLGNTEVESDILFELSVASIVVEGASVGNLTTSNFLTKSLTEEFLFFKLALVTTPRLNCSDWSFFNPANSKAEDCLLTLEVLQGCGVLISNAEDCLLMDLVKIEVGNLGKVNSSKVNLSGSSRVDPSLTMIS